MLRTFALLSLLTLAAGPAAAEQTPAALEEAVAKLIPGIEPDRISASPLPGLYEVFYGPTVIYVSADGRYVVRGDLLDVKEGVNLTEERRKQARLHAIETLGEDSLIVFSPEDGKVEHRVTVFTDVECPYCQRMHRQIQDYLDRGIEIRYAAFPRAGVPSRAYTTMVSVWCADDPQQAMTDAKAGRRVPPKRCENPVEAQFELGRRLNIRGTPTLVTEDGTMIPGYLPARELARRMDSAGS
ncbi:MAG: DsbC family protein [Gammaproteobacteria bacterium]|nr:DsbC family protein [Gammaproteobacteria bacterium]NIR84763.1 DsbC family protein [Gammaproteobacteria bacterium]NIR91259.1 DsbC family protein [Gammaproteobacteria bacterium]NIU05806.1 DsbC family protein [Gammaproteobacteria bacterium]NIV52925.1 thioredoxin fold domain-containing protein [Gammaproteobacteria bacterium]